jgi:hypothetical protein
VHESGSRHLADNSIFSNARFAPIMSKKSFLADKRNFLRPLMRFALGDMRDVIVPLDLVRSCSCALFRATGVTSQSYQLTPLCSWLELQEIVEDDVNVSLNCSTPRLSLEKSRSASRR